MYTFLLYPDLIGISLEGYMLDAISSAFSIFMDEVWEKKIKEKLADFLAEFAKICKNCGRKNTLKILFATKYLDSYQFVTFLNICKEIDPDLIGVDILPVTIGENRVQEAQKKMDFVKENCPGMRKFLNYVMIGSLQKNKINKAINLFDEIHSIDSLELAVVLDERLGRVGKIMPIFLEVNVSGEKSKHGFSLEKIDKALKELKLLKSLRIRGLMTMAPLENETEKSRPVFQKLKELANRYNLLTSMGMSSDWKVAIEEGSDMIRIGARIFNP